VPDMCQKQSFELGLKRWVVSALRTPCTSKLIILTLVALHVLGERVAGWHDMVSRDTGTNFYGVLHYTMYP